MFDVVVWGLERYKRAQILTGEDDSLGQESTIILVCWLSK